MLAQMFNLKKIISRKDEKPVKETLDRMKLETRDKSKIMSSVKICKNFIMKDKKDSMENWGVLSVDPLCVGVQNDEFENLEEPILEKEVDENKQEEF